MKVMHKKRKLALEQKNNLEGSLSCIYKLINYISSSRQLVENRFLEKNTVSSVIIIDDKVEHIQNQLQKKPNHVENEIIDKNIVSIQLPEF